MYYIKNHKQANICDPWEHIGPKRRTLLNKSWSGLFQQKILPTLPVDALRKHYHDWNGRPTKELYSMIGMMILQQMHDLTDDEAVEQFCFNIQYHYALNITSPTDAAAYISHKTLWTMRDKLSSEEIYQDIFKKTLKTLEKLFQADLKKQRMDSVHIQSNMRHLGRIGLFVRTIRKFLNNLKRHHRSLYDKLDSDLVNRYMSTKSESLFAMVKPSESGQTLAQLARDLFALLQHFDSASSVHDMSSFKLLTRLFKEQCVVEQEDGEPCQVVVRSNKEVSSNSLHNPSDPDAGYSNNKGQGYQVQVVENYSTSDKQLSLITHVAVESSDQHDANALLPALKDLNERDVAPEELLADSLYGSDSNCEQAKADYGVDLVAPVMPGNRKKMTLADFALDTQGRIITCPQMVAPDKVKKTTKGFSAAFPADACLGCEDLDHCPVSRGRKACYYRYRNKDIRLALRRQYEATSAFRDKYRYRAGVEATISEYDRRTGVKHLRVRGIKAVKYAAVMKAIGLNIFRAGRHWREQTPPKAPLRGTTLACLALFCHIKDQVFQQVLVVLPILATLLVVPKNRQKIQL